ncbi:hypothetical protein A5672_21850 [Mycobacterium alsense]|uniref:DUF732 domain-containing protein n=1 Tax=Mycobacterium alsense TaxID=324058 RepID=A0ABD6NXS8_9MYCO|nr:DUF732 domain-containing protein [Mycobacterium alsense]OBG35125.1 hypothetical protein A5672_21850 [Mycobacterium alsense]OBJ03360.1 hypothetical protein A5660_20680 [Mycobacterium alsense]
MHANVGFRPRWSLVAALLCVVAPLFAAPAVADSTDDAFLAALAGQNIPVPDPNAAIQTARNMCALFDQGMTRPLLVMKLIKDANLSARQAGFFLGASAAAYCPQYKSSAG